MKNVGNSSRGRSQRVPKFFGAPMCRAHCAVIFAIAQLSCRFWSNTKEYRKWEDSIYQILIPQNAIVIAIVNKKS